jgi:hypothetical protein
MDTEEPKSHIQRVWERMCVRACICAEGKKSNDGEYQSFRDSAGPQNSPETAVTKNRVHKIRFQHAGLKPLKRISRIPEVEAEYTAPPQF